MKKLEVIFRPKYEWLIVNFNIFVLEQECHPASRSQLFLSWWLMEDKNIPKTRRLSFFWKGPESLFFLECLRPQCGFVVSKKVQLFILYRLQHNFKPLREWMAGAVNEGDSLPADVVRVSVSPSRVGRVSSPPPLHPPKNEGFFPSNSTHSTHTLPTVYPHFENSTHNLSGWGGEGEEGCSTHDKLYQQKLYPHISQSPPILVNVAKFRKKIEYPFLWNKNT